MTSQFDKASLENKTIETCAKVCENYGEDIMALRLRALKTNAATQDGVHEKQDGVSAPAFAAPFEQPSAKQTDAEPVAWIVTDPAANREDNANITTDSRVADGWRNFWTVVPLYAAPQVPTSGRDGELAPDAPLPAGAAPSSIAPVAQQQPTSEDVRDALLFCLWHHQGGSSKIGQPIRAALGIRPHEPLNAEQLDRAKRVQSALSAIAPGDEFGTLLRFYNVSTFAELVNAQARHIEKLQAKVPPLRDEQPGRVREG